MIDMRHHYHLNRGAVDNGWLIMKHCTEVPYEYSIKMLMELKAVFVALHYHSPTSISRGARTLFILEHSLAALSRKRVCSDSYSYYF